MAWRRLWLPSAWGTDDQVNTDHGRVLSTHSGVCTILLHLKPRHAWHAEISLPNHGEGRSLIGRADVERGPGLLSEQLSDAIVIFKVRASHKFRSCHAADLSDYYDGRRLLVYKRTIKAVGSTAREMTNALYNHKVYI